MSELVPGLEEAIRICYQYLMEAAKDVVAQGNQMISSSMAGGAKEDLDEIARKMSAAVLMYSDAASWILSYHAGKARD